MTLTPAEAGVLLALVFAVFYWLGIFATTTAVLGFLWVTLLGTSGWVGRILGDVTSLAVRLTGQVGGDLFGGFLVAGITVALAIVYFHDLHPRNVTGRRTAWIGAALACLVDAGLTGIPALSGLHEGIVSAVTSAIGAL